MNLSRARLCHLARTSFDPIARARALTALAERLQWCSDDGPIINGCSADPTPVPLEDVLEVALSSLSDGTPSVASAAFAMLQALLRARPLSCSTHLARILTVLLLAASGGNGADGMEDGAAESQVAARSALGLILERQRPLSLVASLGTVLVCDDPSHPCTEVARLTALELLEKRLAEAPFTAEAADQAQVGAEGSCLANDEASSEPLVVMRRLVEDLLCCSSGANQTVRRSTTRCLHALFLHETHSFLATAAALNSKQSALLVSALGHLVPDLAENIASQANAPMPHLHERWASQGQPSLQQPHPAIHANYRGQSPLVSSGRQPADEPKVAPFAAKAPGPPWANGWTGLPSSSFHNHVASPCDAPCLPVPQNQPSSQEPPYTQVPNLASEPEVDASSQASQRPAISVLLRHCGPPTQRATLRALALAARTEGQKAWEKHFGRVLILVLDSLTQPQAQGVRETALSCLQELVVHQPTFFGDFAEVVASKLFEAYRSCDQADKQTAAAIERTLERLIGVVESTRGLEILLPVVSSEGVPLLQAATRLLSSVLQRMQPNRVLEQLDVVLPGVVVALGNPSSEVRKAAVFCLVDVYMILGEQVMPYLAKDLTPSQMKLVTIYIGRQQREREELNPEDLAT